MLQNATVLRKSAPWPPNISDEDVSCAAPATSFVHLYLQMSHACHRFWTWYKTHTFDSLLTRCKNPLRLPRKATPERAKVVRTRCAFRILTSKCASRHTAVQFFHISTSKSAPNMSASCVLTSKFDKFASRRNRSNFSDLLSPDGSAPAALASLLFDPPEPQNHASRLFYKHLFTHFDLCNSDSLSSLISFFSSLLWLFPPLLPHLSILSEVWFLHFLLRQAQIMCALGNGVLLFEAVWGLCVPGLIRRLQLSIQSVIRSSARSFSLLHCYCAATLYFPGRPIDRCQKCPRVATCCTQDESHEN